MGTQPGNKSLQLEPQNFVNKWTCRARWTIEVLRQELFRCACARVCVCVCGGVDTGSSGAMCAEKIPVRYIAERIVLNTLTNTRIHSEMYVASDSLHRQSTHSVNKITKNQTSRLQACVIAWENCEKICYMGKACEMARKKRSDENSSMCVDMRVFVELMVRRMSDCHKTSARSCACVCVRPNVSVSVWVGWIETILTTKVSNWIM